MNLLQPPPWRWTSTTTSGALLRISTRGRLWTAFVDTQLIHLFEPRTVLLTVSATNNLIITSEHRAICRCLTQSATCLNVRLFERETKLRDFFLSFLFLPQYNNCWIKLLQMADCELSELLCCQPEGPCGGASAAAASGSLTPPWLTQSPGEKLPWPQESAQDRREVTISKNLLKVLNRLWHGRKLIGGFNKARVN